MAKCIDKGLIKQNHPWLRENGFIFKVMRFPKNKKKNKVK